MKTKNRFIFTILVITALVITACGQGTESEQNLVFTEWEVSEMEGFPAANEVEGTFNFTEERFRYNDGLNSASVTVE